jgi:hypothetical protein
MAQELAVTGKSEVTDGCQTSDYEQIYEVSLQTFYHQHFNQRITSFMW